MMVKIPPYTFEYIKYRMRHDHSAEITITHGHGSRVERELSETLSKSSRRVKIEKDTLETHNNNDRMRSFENLMENKP